MRSRVATKLAGAGLAAALALVGMAGTASADGPSSAKRQPAPSVRRPVPPPVLGGACPDGTFLSAFQMPIYDAETGLWVIGYQTVWYCLPEGLEPAG